MALLQAPLYNYLTGKNLAMYQISTDSIILAGAIGLVCLMLGTFLTYIIYKNYAKEQHEKRLQQATRREAERARQSERKRLRAVYNLVAALTASLNYQRVLDNALDLSGNILGTLNSQSERLVSAVLLFSNTQNRETELSVGSARRFTPSDMRIILPGTSGMIGQAIETGAPSQTKDIPADPELKRIVALRMCTSAYCIPLRAGIDVYGVLLFAHPETNYFISERSEILDIIGTQAVTAIQNARLYNDLAQEKERMMEIQEEARKKLARDLHDGPTQSVAAIAMRVNFARRLMERDAKATAEELFKIEDLARRTTKEIRHMLFTLRPLVLESQGLVAALEAMADKMTETYDQRVTIEADPTVIPELEMGKQAVIFYIVEEAVNNARKHAQAENICVRLKSMENNLALLEIEDNGVGFNVGAVDAFYDKRGSLGMVNMRERAELVNGVLRIDSVEGSGTLIQVVIPLTEEAADRLRSRI